MGKKSIMTEEVYTEVIPLLHNVDSNGIPKFVKELEAKEKYLADQLLELARRVAKSHSIRVKNKHNVEIAKEAESSISLDVYICCWFSIMCMDKAKDSKENFEEWMHKMTGGEFLDS